MCSIGNKMCRVLLPLVFAVAVLLSYGLTRPAGAAEAASLKAAPVLAADTAQNVIRKPVELNFTDEAAWRDAISEVDVDGTALDAEKYSIEAGKITIDRSLFRVSRDYDIVVKAGGYKDTGVRQKIGLLYITGDAVPREIVFTRAELAAMDQARVIFSATNDFPVDLFVAVEGVPLRSLLEKAGMRPEAQMVVFTGTDGYVAGFFVDELLRIKRYKFPDHTVVEPVVALKRMERSVDFSEMNEQDTPVICFGQRAPTEQTLLGFCKMVQAITVTADAPEQWGGPSAVIVDPDTGQETAAQGGQGKIVVKSGSKVYLEGSSPKTKIYYTTDGTVPGLDSQIFNAHGCGPLAGQDEPVLVDKDITVKAKGVWFGKRDSDVVTFNFVVGGGVQQTAAATGPVNGVSELPPGEPGDKITRAEFVSLLVLQQFLTYVGLAQD